MGGSHSGSREVWGPWTGPCLSLAQDPEAFENDHPAQDKKQEQADDRGARWLPTTDRDIMHFIDDIFCVYADVDVYVHMYDVCVCICVCLCM